MSIKNIVSLTFILFFILISCIPINKTIGDEFIPEDYILTVDTAFLDLNIVTKMPDSIQSISNSHMMIGSLADPVFGVTTSSTIVDILPYSNSSDFGDNPQIKSVSLKLIVNNTVNYSEKYEGIAQNIYVYKLKSPIDTSRLFNTSFTADDYDPNSIHLGDPVYYGGDTIGITLSNEFGKLLLETPPSEFKEEGFKLFKERIKGLYITTDTLKVKEGGRLNYLPVGSSNIILNYLITDAEQDLKDRDTTEMFVVGSYYALNQVQSGSKSLASDDSKETIYIDAFSGVKPYLNGAELWRQLHTWLSDNNYTNKSIILSRASINLPFEMPKDYTDINEKYPQSIYPCYINSEEDFWPLEDIYSSANIGVINRSLMIYPSDLTSYIQNLIKKDSKEEVDRSDDLWFSSISTIPPQSEGSPTQYQFNYQNYSRGLLNGPTAEKHPTLSLVFTVLKD